MMRTSGLLIACGFLGFASSPAWADVCLTVEGVTQNLTHGTQGSCTTSTESKVKLNDTKDVDKGTGTVDGFTVDFSTSGLFDLANGTANIRPPARSKSYPDLTIVADRFTFTDLLFGLQMADLGTDSLTVQAWDGATLEGQWDLTGISHDKDDKFAIVASANQLFTEVVLTAGSDSGIFETKQLNFSGVSAIPEPSTWAMMLIGFAGLGYAGYRTSKSPRGMVSVG